MIATASARATALASAGQTENPFAAWNNQAATATLSSGDPVLTDGALANAVSGTTYDYWLPSVTGSTVSFFVTFPAARTISFVGIAAHNLATLGANVRVQRSTTGTGGPWTDAGAGLVTPTDNSPIGFRMVTSGNDAADWRILFSGLTASAPLYVGVVFFGNDMVFPSRFYKDFAPNIRPTEVQLQSNVSVGGNLLGNSIIAQGSTINAQIRHLTPAFVRGDMLEFIPHFNAGKGFFFAWRPNTYAQDMAYAWREGATLRPVNSGPRDYMAIEMGMRAYEG